MKKNQLREFPVAGVVAGVLLANGKDFLEVDDQGHLAIPAGVEPKGFHLVVAVRDNGRTFVAQKDVSTTGGGYASQALSQLANFAKGFCAVVMREPIEVVRAGVNVWTSWHAQKPNRVDVWYLGEDGQLWLYQIGVFTHDDGKSWKLHGEFRWCGQLYVASNSQFVAKPDAPEWGPLEGGSSKRTQIFSHPEFVALLKSAKITLWMGTPEEADPPLPKKVPGPGYARVLWYISFASQKGAGVAELADGSMAWIQAADIVGLEPDEDGEIRLLRGDIVSFTGKVENWGSKKGGPPKLTGVRRV